MFCCMTVSDLLGAADSDPERLVVAVYVGAAGDEQVAVGELGACHVFFVAGAVAKGFGPEGVAAGIAAQEGSLGGVAQGGIGDFVVAFGDGEGAAIGEDLVVAETECEGIAALGA